MVNIRNTVQTITTHLLLMKKYLKNRRKIMIPQLYFMDLSGRDNECITDLDLYINTTGTSIHKGNFSASHRFGRNDYHLLYLCSGDLNIVLIKNNKKIKQKYGPLGPYFFYL